MKKALSIFLALVLLFALTAPALADKPEETDPTPETPFEIDEAGVLTKYNGPGGDVTVPDGVTAIGDRAFYKADVTSVVLPAGVLSIGERAFSHCDALTAVTLPDGLISIGEAAFSADGALVSINLPETISSIGKGAFTGTALTKAELPSGLTALPDYLFSSCGKLESVAIGADVASIGVGAFLGCDALAEIRYAGSMSDWRAIAIAEQNEPLTAASLIVGVGADTVIFADVPEDAYYAIAVNWAVEVGVTNGTKLNDENGKNWFSPDAAVTRGQAVTFLWRARGCPEPETKQNPFADVKETDYFYKAVLWAVEREITNGTKAADENGPALFSPSRSVTRGQMLTFLWRAMGRLGETEDYKGKPWYSDPEYWANETGLTAGLPKAYVRDEPCPRSDVVYYLFVAIVFSGVSGTDFGGTEFGEIGFGGI